MKTTRSLAAVAVLALALPLAACSSDSSKDADSTSSAAATTAATAEASTAASADASSSADASMPAAPTDGQEVTASTVGVTFNVPADWNVITDTSSIDDETVNQFASAAGQDAGTFKSLLGQVDLLALSPEAKAAGTGTFNANIVVTRQTVPESQVPADEASATAFTKATGGENMTKFEKVGTANGEATVVHYDMGQQGTTIYGAAVFAPTADGSYAVITVTASEVSTTDELVTRVTSSVK